MSKISQMNQKFESDNITKFDYYKSSLDEVMEQFEGDRFETALVAELKKFNSKDFFMMDEENGWSDNSSFNKKMDTFLKSLVKNPSKYEIFKDGVKKIGSDVIISGKVYDAKNRNGRVVITSTNEGIYLYSEVQLDFSKFLDVSSGRTIDAWSGDELK
ncbi:structural protein [Yersinia phage vB_Yru_GN1]|uniref:Structural protein n=1 Tax=Yersinia phage vB_Yru_GN1 TaxID=3074381 RepID=A0AA86J0B7_9CAUD|nr:structural protein [Yersinia phage vB_Yru_GN1]